MPLGVIQGFTQEYLRKLTQADVDCLLQVAEARDFSSVLRSIACVHWFWKNYPSGWKGVLVKGLSSCFYDLLIWYAFFRCLRSSLVFKELYEAQASKCDCTINSHKYNIIYFLSDDIYKKMDDRYQNYPSSLRTKAKLFIERQELVKKYVEKKP